MLADGDTRQRAASEPARFTLARQSLAELVGHKGADLLLVARKGGGGGGQPACAVEQSARARAAPEGGKQPGSPEGASRRGGVLEREPRPARSSRLVSPHPVGNEWATWATARMRPSRGPVRSHTASTRMPPARAVLRHASGFSGPHRFEKGPRGSRRDRRATGRRDSMRAERRLRLRARVERSQVCPHVVSCCRSRWATSGSEKRDSGKPGSSGRGPSQLRVTAAGETTSGSRSRWLSRGTGEGPRRVPAEGRRPGSGKPCVLHGACGGSDLGPCPTASSVESRLVRR